MGQEMSGPREFSRDTSLEHRRTKVPPHENPLVQRIVLALTIVGGIIGVATYTEARIKARTGISTSIGSIETNIKNIKDGQNRIEISVQAIDNRVRVVENQATGMRTRLDTMEEALSVGVTGLKTLESSVSYLQGVVRAPPPEK